MVKGELLKIIESELNNLEAAGLYKEERTVGLQPDQMVELSGGSTYLNFCSSDYLGLASDSDLGRVEEGSSPFGSSSTRLLCGTLKVHQDLESWLSLFFDREASMVLPTVYEAHLGIFEALCGEKDVIILDALASSSLRDGARLSQAKVLFYQNNDMQNLEEQLKKTEHHRFRFIVTDGVFTLNGIPSDLISMVDLSKKYNATLIVSDVEGVGVMGATGRGALQWQNVQTEVDLLIGSLGHLIGESGGGFISGRKDLIRWLKQKSKPYLFQIPSSPRSLFPYIKLIERLNGDQAPLDRLNKLKNLFGQSLVDHGLEVLGFDHPIIAVRIGNAVATQRIVNYLFEKQIYATGYCYPLVPRGEALLRFQITAGHSVEALTESIQTLTHAVHRFLD